MSDNNMFNNQYLTQSQIKQKRKMLLEMEHEIQQLKFDINHPNIVNKRINLLRRIKTILCAGQLIAPYILTAGITFAGLAAHGTTPFIIDNQKKVLEVKKEMDSFGNIKYERQYENFNNPIETISYIGKWNKKNNNLYSREIKTYSIEKIDEYIITKMIKDGDTLSLNEVFGQPISLKTESKKYLTDEEISKEPYLEAVIYFKLDDDYIMEKESIEKNIYTTFFWIIISLILEPIPAYIRYKHSSFDFEDSIDEINEKYPLITTNELTKKLEIKINNYKRLTR